jgi:tetratricopeptide (TPR) repeat protein
MRLIFAILSGVFVAVLVSVPCIADTDVPDSAASFGDSVVARIIDCREPIKLTGGQPRSIRIGEELHKQDAIELSAEGQCTLIFRDGTVRTYDGPVSIYFDTPQPSATGNLLKKIAYSIAEIFFVSDQSTEDAQLGTRTSWLDDPVDRVPRLVYPPDEIRLLQAPAYLKWRFVEGVTDYSVSVYEGNKLLLNTNSTDTSVEIDPDLWVMKTGASYVWRVKAIVGDSCLRSSPSTFYLVDESRRIDINRSVKSIDDSISDDRLARLMKGQLYRELGLLLDCYRELESVLTDYPDDATLLRAKAEVLYDMGLVEEALATYRELLN